VALEYVYRTAVMKNGFDATSDIAGASRQDGCCCSMRRGDDRSEPREQFFVYGRSRIFCFPRQHAGSAETVSQCARLKTCA